MLLNNLSRMCLCTWLCKFLDWAWQEARIHGSGKLSGATAKLARFAGPNASRDFWRHAKLPVEPPNALMHD